MPLCHTGSGWCSHNPGFASALKKPLAPHQTVGHRKVAADPCGGLNGKMHPIVFQTKPLYFSSMLLNYKHSNQPALRADTRKYLQ